MKTKLVIFIGCLFLLTGMVYVDAAFAAPTSTPAVIGDRDLPDSYLPSERVEYTINIDLDENNSPASIEVNEIIPIGWSNPTSTPSITKDVDGVISWLFSDLLNNLQDTIITIWVDAPSTCGATTFSGDVSYSDIIDVIGGDTQTICIEPPHDYYCDNDDDGYISPSSSGTCLGIGCEPAGCQPDPGNDCDDGNNLINPGADDSSCNAIDEDCSGTPDDGYVEIQTNCGVGECAATGEKTCVEGDEVDSCTPGEPSENPEATCDDGLDNDCDGYTDSLDSIDCPDCIPTGLPDDNCDGIDDDCNDLVDDGYVVEQTTCGQGACAGNTGQFECQPGGNVVNTCNPFEGAAEGDSECNGIDDDCDGLVDDGYVVKQTICGLGACAGNTGQFECQPGGNVVNTCDPFAGAAADDSVCNGIDDDCDGPVDEDYVPTSTTCGKGVCGSAGQLECLSGQKVDSCTPEVPTEDPEATCNDSKDNDCDGDIDIIDSDCGPEITVTPERVDFGCVDANESESIILEITNTGNAVLNTVMAIEDEQFEVVVDNCSGVGIDPNDDPCTVEIAFKPVEEEEAEADSAVNSTNLTITSADVPEITKNIPLRGTWILSTVDIDHDCIPVNEDVDDNDDTIASPQSAEGTGSITVDASLRLSDVQSFSDDDPVVNQEGNPSGYEFIDGLVSFKVNDVLPDPDDRVTVVITFPSPIPAGAKYFKVDDNGFYEFGAADINYADNTVTLTLTDAVGTGDRDKGDKDGTLGVIADPGGIASLVATAEICDDNFDNDLDGDTDCADSDCAQASNCTTGGGDSDDTVDSSGSGSSGKCFITTAAYGNNIADEVMPLIVLVGMIAIGGVVVIRRRK